ncbi:MAG: ComF family protein [Bacteroidetes bacterium]|nr:ComF family protein [Bacteroidota bacterium]
MVKGEDILCTHCLVELPKTQYHEWSDNPIKNRLSVRLPVVHAWAYLKFRKTGLVQHLLHQLKYNNHPEVGLKLGKAYAYDLKKAGHEKSFDLIIPVPLHPSRRRRRGYNQSAKFAEGLSSELNIPFDDNISLRTISTVTQTKKSKLQRWENVESVFALHHTDKIIGKRILLVDDVITTGATIEACGNHLLKNGCAELSVACIAEAQ